MDFNIGGRGTCDIGVGELFHSTLTDSTDQVFMRLAYEPEIVAALMSDSKLMLCLRLNDDKVGHLATYLPGTRYTRLQEQSTIDIEEG